VSYAGEAFTAQCDRVSESEWNALLEGFVDASVYHTWAYGAVCWGEKQLSHLVLRRGGAPVALAQLRIVRVPVIGSGIAYVRWGPVCTPERLTWEPGVWRAAIDALVQEYVVRRGLVLRIVPNAFLQNSVSGATRDICSELGLAEEVSVRPYHTIRVDLRPSVEALRRQLSSRWRRQLNIAERNHLEIVGGHTDDLYEQFLRLYGEMMARKQFDTSVDVNDFRRIQQRLPQSQKMMILICLAGGTPVAGLVVATVGHTAIYLLAATGDTGLDARGSYLLQWHAIQRLKELGREWYDLGGINEKVNPGVFTFKSGMGGEAVRQIGCYQIGHSSLSRWSVFVGERAGRTLRRLGRRRIGRV
jgi:hypothetical protein